MAHYFKSLTQPKHRPISASTMIAVRPQNTMRPSTQYSNPMRLRAKFTQRITKKPNRAIVPKNWNQLISGAAGLSSIPRLYHKAGGIP